MAEGMAEACAPRLTVSRRWPAATPAAVKVVPRSMPNAHDIPDLRKSPESTEAYCSMPTTSPGCKSRNLPHDRHQLIDVVATRREGAGTDAAVGTTTDAVAEPV